RRKLVDPAPGDRIVDGIAAEEIPESVHSRDAGQRLRLARKNCQRAIESSRVLFQRISIRQHDLLVEIDAGRVDPRRSNQSSETHCKLQCIDANGRWL